MSRPFPRRSNSILGDLPFCLARTTLTFRRFSDQLLREAGVASQAPGLASVLHAAEELGDCSVGRLVEMTHLPNGTLTGLIDTLQQDGYVRRIPNPADGRSWLIQLTKKGNLLCRKLRGRHELVMRCLSVVLSQEEQNQFKRLLDKLTGAMRADAAERDPPSVAARGIKATSIKPSRPRVRTTISKPTQNKKL